MAEDEWTPAEMTRALQRIEQSIKDGRRDIEHSLVRKDVYERDRETDDKRFGSIEESLRWTRRTVIGAVIALAIPLASAALVIR